MNNQKPLLFVLITLNLLITAITVRAAEFPIIKSQNADVRENWAATELSIFLSKIYDGDTFPVKTTIPKKGTCILLGTYESMPELNKYIDKALLADTGSFVVTHLKVKKQKMGIIAGNNSRGVLDGVYSLLEQKLGYSFYLHSNASENMIRDPFSFERWDLSAQPEFNERVVFNWYNFITGVSGWNLEDYKDWIRQSARMRFTSVMLHAYSWSPFHQFIYNGETKPVLRIQNTQYGALWDNKQTDDIRTLIGGKRFVDEGPVFGADAGKIGYDGVTLENRVAKAKELMRQVVSYAVDTVGMEFIWAIDIDTGYANPQNVIQTLPEESRIRIHDEYIVRPDTEDGYLYFKNIVQTIMTDYPGISTITAWWRANSAKLYDGFINSLPYDHKLAHIPDDWKAEYDAAPDYVKASVSPKFSTLAPANLYYSKVTGAFRKALDELGFSDVKLGYGSWVKSNEVYNSFVPANYFQNQEVTAYALEYKMTFDHNVPFRKQLFETGKKRNLVVIEWAHHDDGKYLGRPYTPPTNFTDKLNESKASGFGIIHWMTRPFDIFFKNLQNQVWSNTLNESYAKTCEKMALDYFGTSQAKTMNDYLVTWLTTAPQFGRETGYLGQTGVKDFENRINKCNERIAILDQVDTASFTTTALNRWKYFKGHEEWIKLFHQAQQNWDEDLQKETIYKFIEKASVDGDMNRCEEGLLIQHNIKWLNKSKEHKRMMDNH
ncbi:MAG: hypothetical protein DWQ10_05280 [Calditrichaeota bacterium]|nr:MAG: hypothetical protein DWQ10_05280 [Calditrichota bacterium]